MRLRSIVPGAFLLLAFACARPRSVAPAVLAVADPQAPESAFVAPTDTLGGKPRTLDLVVDDPRTHRTGTKEPEDAHRGHDAAPTPTPSATPKHGASTPKATATPKPQATVYACPMHPEVTSDKPGTCPKCGMKLEPLKGEPAPTPKPGHEHEHEGHR